MNQSPLNASPPYPYDTPTFKTNALHLISNEGWLKCLLLLYMAIHFAIFFTYDTPTFKTEALEVRLVSNKGQVKCLLLLFISV